MFSNWKKVDNCIYDACKPFSSECTSKNRLTNTMNKLLLRSMWKLGKWGEDSQKYESENANKRQTKIWKWKFQ